MATVGNLFVNIRGNTRGLEQSLKKAKEKLSAFKQLQKAGAARADLAKQTGRMRAMEQQAFGSIFAKEGPQYKRASGLAKGARAAIGTAEMGAFVSAAFATIGVTAAAAGVVIRKAQAVQATTEEDFATFTATGAAIRNRELLDRIAFVRRPDVAEGQRQIAEDRRSIAQQERELYGDTGEGFRMLGQEMSRAFNDAYAFVSGRQRTTGGGYQY